MFRVQVDVIGDERRIYYLLYDKMSASFDFDAGLVGYLRFYQVEAIRTFSEAAQYVQLCKSGSTLLQGSEHRQQLIQKVFVQ